MILFDTQLEREIWSETAIDLIINNEYEDHEGHHGRTLDEIKQHVLDNIDEYLAFYDYVDIKNFINYEITSDQANDIYKGVNAETHELYSGYAVSEELDIDDYRNYDLTLYVKDTEEYLYLRTY